MSAIFESRPRLPRALRLSSRVPSMMHGERANQLTHGLGLVLSLAGAGEMIRRLILVGEAWQWVGCLLYLASLITLFAASTLSHSFASRERRDFYRMLDQVCIFALCSGSLTPFALRYLSVDWWWLLAASWCFALVGCLMKIYVAKAETLTVIVYVALGWLPALAAQPLMSQMPMGAQLLIGGAAASYMIGLIFLVNDLKHRYFHAVWHVLVIAGTACVYVAMLWCVVPLS